MERQKETAWSLSAPKRFLILQTTGSQPVAVSGTVSGWIVVQLSRERLDCGGLVIPDIEHGVQLRDLQEVVNFLGKVQQFQFAATIANAGEGAYQFTDARAVDISHIGQVQQDFLVSLAYQVANDIAEHRAAFAECNTATQIHDGDTIDLSGAGLHGHLDSSLPPAALPR